MALRCCCRCDTPLPAVGSHVECSSCGTPASLWLVRDTGGRCFAAATPRRVWAADGYDALLRDLGPLVTATT